MIVFRMFPAEGVIALYGEEAGGGDPLDINSARNAPALDPQSYLANIFFHSALDNFEVVDSDTVTVSHAQVNTAAPPAGQFVAFGWSAAAADHLLLSHSLGYEPFALVAVGDNILWPGMPVQTDASGGGRYVTPYVTTTGVYIYEWASIGASNLAAADLDYTVIIFKNPPDPSGNKLFDFDPDTGIITMAFNRFDTSRQYLQVVAGGTPFGLSVGRTIDLDNGAPRAVRPDGTTFDPVPSGLSTRVQSTFQPAPAFGASMAYGGSFTGGDTVEVQVP